MKFKNLITEEILSHAEFVSFIWEEAERQFNNCHDTLNWSNLSRDEQIVLYCEQYEYQLSGDWTSI